MAIRTAALYAADYDEVFESALLNEIVTEEDRGIVEFDELAELLIEHFSE